MHFHVVVARELDRSQREHAPAGGRHLEHLVERDPGQLARLGHDPRIGGVHALHVGVDLAHLGVERGGQRDRGEVGGTPTHGRDLALGRHALETGDDRDLARGQRLADPVALDLDDLGPVVLGVGDDPGLRSRERHRRHAEVLHRHAHERHRDALAGGEQHVELAAVGMLGDVVREAQQVVGRLAHRRHHDHHVVARTAGPGHVIGYGSDAVGVGHRGAAEFLHEKHGNQG